VVIDPASGTQWQLGGPPVASVSAAFPGVITPDGALAAVFRVTAGDQASLHLVNLVTGADQQITVPLSQTAVRIGTLAWSPDGRWLFVITAGGRLAAVNAATRQVEGLGVRLPWLSQIAIRPG
jgi:Tol biopolymer transport system component